MDYSYLDYGHLDSVLEIERESNPYPWTARNFSDCIEKCYYSMVLEENERLVGFAIMGFAPMPVFSSYGQITAVMIVFALIASLIVLPCLLVLITRE